MSEYGRRKTPPKTDEEHAHIWDSSEKAQKAWVVVGPIHAAVTNWKGWAVIVLVFGFLKGDKVVNAVINFLEGMK